VSAVTPEVVQAVQQKLTRIMVGGCTCMTKTPELRYHNERCHFRLASEASALLTTHGVPVARGKTEGSS
jgi:hypothetical protein